MSATASSAVGQQHRRLEDDNENRFSSPTLRVPLPVRASVNSGSSFASFAGEEFDTGEDGRGRWPGSLLGRFRRRSSANWQSSLPPTDSVQSSPPQSGCAVPESFATRILAGYSDANTTLLYIPPQETFVDASGYPVQFENEEGERQLNPARERHRGDPPELPFAAGKRGTTAQPQSATSTSTLLLDGTLTASALSHEDRGSDEPSAATRRRYSLAPSGAPSNHNRRVSGPHGSPRLTPNSSRESIPYNSGDDGEYCDSGSPVSRLSAVSDSSIPPEGSAPSLSKDRFVGSLKRTSRKVSEASTSGSGAGILTTNPVSALSSISNTVFGDTREPGNSDVSEQSRDADIAQINGLDHGNVEWEDGGGDDAATGSSSGEMTPQIPARPSYGTKAIPSRQRHRRNRSSRIQRDSVEDDEEEGQVEVEEQEEDDVVIVGRPAGASAAPLLTVPLAFQLLTPKVASCVVLFFALLTSATLKSSVRASRRLVGDTGAVNWAGVARAAVGGTRWQYYGGEGWPGGAEMDGVDIVVCVLTLGSCSGYLVAVSDSLSRVAEAAELSSTLKNWATDRSVWIGVCTVLLIPLSLPRHLYSLRFSSVLGDLAVIYVVFMVVMWWRVHGDHTAPVKVSLDVDGASSGVDLFKDVGEFAVKGIYAISLLIYTVYNELQDHNFKRMGIVIDISLALSAVVYMFIGWFGWLTWKDKVAGNLLNNYPITSVTAVIARVAFSISLMASYAVQFQSCRSALASLLTRLRRRLHVLFMSLAYGYGSINERHADNVSVRRTSSDTTVSDDGRRSSIMGSDSDSINSAIVRGVPLDGNFEWYGEQWGTMK
ncbi:hypothetical protein HDU93_007114 [Gonapodya sp. JEL0774]|nr:hypothetical protein HDU93_007114 [Gonapodya sp. JEL0774]